MRRAALSLILLALAAGPAGAAPERPAPSPDRSAVLELIRADRDSAALAALRAYAAARPDDDLMLYNLACLEARAGRVEAALTSLEQAVVAGFADPGQLAADPDLDALRGTDRYAALVTELESRLVLQAAERGAELAPGRPATLVLAPGRPSPSSAGPPALTLLWQPEALVLRLDGGGRWEADPASRPRLVVTLGVPDPERPWLTRNAFHFAFGAGPKGGGRGAVWVPTLGRWQPVAELAPHFTASGVATSARIPWSLIRPLHPLTDPRLGLNATLVHPDAAGGPATAAILPDPDAFDPAAAAHRVVRLDCDPEGYPGPALLGRLDDSIVRGGVLDFELVLVPPTPGQGTLTVDFVDNRGRSLLDAGPQAGTFDFAGGVQRLSRQASFAGLGTGAYQLRAEAGWPGGGSAAWSTSVLNLAPGWADSLEARSAALAPRDRRTARHLLAAVREAVAGHLPRRHPGPIARTLGDLDAMLTRAERTGSVLPATGAGLFVYAGPDGGDRLCTVFRPAPGAERGAETPVLVLADAPGGEDLLAGRLARFYEHGDLTGAGDRHPLYLVPHLPAADGAAEAAAAMAAVRDRFAGPAPLVAGIDAGAGLALRTAAARPGDVGGLMLLAGGRFDPWPGAPADTLAARLAALPADLPLDWTAFPRETARAGRAPEVRRLLAAAHPQLVLRTAAGGLSASQAADRIVLWAEELPVPGGAEGDGDE